MDIVARLIAAVWICAGVLLASDASAYGRASMDTGPLYSSDCGSGSTVTARVVGTVIEACRTRVVVSGVSWAGGCERTYSNEVTIKNTSVLSDGSVRFAFEGLRSFSTPAGCNAVAGYMVDLGGATAGKSIQQSCTSGSSEIPGAPGNCQCDEGFKSDPASPGKCKPYSCPAPGAYSAVTQPDQSVQNVGSICMDGCTVNPASVKASVDGKLYATWPFVSTGKSCGGAVNPLDSPIKTGSDTNPAPAQCPANQCPGVFNGATLCVACKNTSAPGPSSTASAPDAAASSGASGTTTNSDTACDGLKCTTTTTVRDLDGKLISSKSEDKPQPSFCKENPESPMCKKSGFGGSCGAYTCDGDAIQCAIAERIHKSACDLENQDQALVAGGTAALAGGSRPDGHPANDAQTRSVSFGTVIDQSDPIGGGCPVDQAVTVGSVTVVIPWSKACTSLQMLGTIVTAFSMLAAAFIVFRS